MPKGLLIKKISDVINHVKPDEVFVPHISDVHTDHKVISEIISTCTKNFRFKFIKTILAYEVLSETNFNIQKKVFFKPNYYEDISKYINKKVNAMKIYKSEIKKFLFLGVLQQLNLLLESVDQKLDLKQPRLLKF